MDDNTPTADDATRPVRREGPDPVTLAAGLLALIVSAYVLIGGSWNLHWMMAVGAILVGVAMLLASLRSRRGEA